MQQSGGLLLISGLTEITPSAVPKHSGNESRHSDMKLEPLDATFQWTLADIRSGLSFLTGAA